MVKAARDGWTELSREVVACRSCERLVQHRESVARTKRRAYRDEEYWGRPVPSFGSSRPRLWIVGLAPGAHGANRTGRMFTGDSSGDFLYPTLHRFGFASQPDSTSVDDGLRLLDARITNIVKCVPPQNRPSGAEVRACRPFLERERALMPGVRAVVALGALAWEQLARVFEGAVSPPPRFGHGVEWPLDGATVLASYHPSQQNTRTGRLTATMFDRVFRRARRLVDAGESS